MKDIIKQIDNIDNIDELKEIESAIISKLAKLKKIQLSNARKKIQDMAIELDVEISELLPNTSKINAKYICPTDPTKKWSGRGKRPTWLIKAIEEGAKLEDFLI